MLILASLSCGSQNPEQDCVERYHDPVLITDYQEPDAHGWSGAIVTHPDWGDTCALSASPGDWCRAFLPCWQGRACPPFEEFLLDIGWLDEDASYAFTIGTVETYDPSYVFECDIGDHLSFHLRGEAAAPFTVYFSAATDEVVSIARFAPDEFQCVGGAAPHVWWGEPVSLDGDQCEQRSRPEFAQLATEDTGMHGAEDTGGCGCGASAPSSVWLLSVVVTVMGVRRSRPRPDAAGRRDLPYDDYFSPSAPC